MSTELYWISKTVVAEWALLKADGTSASDATVAGTVTLPNGTTAAMTANYISATVGWRLTYDPQTAGLHAYRLTSTGTADSAEEGTFIVAQSLTGAAPITTDPSTSIGRGRLFATDVNEHSPIFTDAQWTAFLAANGSNTRRAAAQALETMAASEVLVSKVIRTQDLATDGAKVAEALRALAKSLRDQADDGWGDDGLTDDTAFEIVDYDPYAGYLSSNELAAEPLP